LLFGVVLASDSQYEGSNSPSFRSPAVDEERMVTGWRQFLIGFDAVVWVTGRASGP